MGSTVCLCLSFTAAHGSSGEICPWSTLKCLASPLPPWPGVAAAASAPGQDAVLQSLRSQNGTMQQVHRALNPVGLCEFPLWSNVSVQSEGSYLFDSHKTCKRGEAALELGL